MSDWILVHIITKLELGGAQLATLYEVAHCTFGLRPHYLMHGPGGLLDPEAAALPGVETILISHLGRAIDGRDDARACQEMVTRLRALRSRHPGCHLLVHTHSSKAGILGRWAAKLAGADRIVHSVHGFGHQPGMPAAMFYALWASERATSAITHGLTADSAANLRRGQSERLWRRSMPTQVVHCGIDVEAFRAPRGNATALRAALNIGASAPVVLMVACLKPQKDPMTFLRVAGRVRQRVPNAVFLLAGDGELRPELEAHISSERLQDTVKLLGWRRDVPDLLHLADVLLLTSRWEGLPQVFAQAMAAGKAIVATDVDGNGEAVENGVTGFLHPVGDAAALADAVVRLLQDSALRARLGAAGAERVHNFSQDTMVACLDTFYASLTKPQLSRDAKAV